MEYKDETYFTIFLLRVNIYENAIKTIPSSYAQ